MSSLTKHWIRQPIERLFLWCCAPRWGGRTYDMSSWHAPNVWEHPVELPIQHDPHEINALSWSHMKHVALLNKPLVRDTIGIMSFQALQPHVSKTLVWPPTLLCASELSGLRVFLHICVYKYKARLPWNNHGSTPQNSRVDFLPYECKALRSSTIRKIRWRHERPPTLWSERLYVL